MERNETASTVDPVLPNAFDLVHLEAADSALDEALRRARADADEGTLVWVDHPQTPTGRQGRRWLLEADPGLHAALILNPDLPATECAQLGPVAVVALGRALAGAVQPMTELHHRWPNDVLLDGGKVAGVWLRGEGTAARVRTLVIAFAVNTRAAPESLGFDASSLVHEGVAGDIDPGELLQAIARQLVIQIETWDEQGFAPILRSFRGRLALGGASHIALADGTTVAGIAEAVDDHGNLRIRADAGTHEIALERFFDLGMQPRDE